MTIPSDDERELLQAAEAVKTTHRLLRWQMRVLREMLARHDQLVLRRELTRRNPGQVFEASGDFQRRTTKPRENL